MSIEAGKKLFLHICVCTIGGTPIERDVCVCVYERSDKSMTKALKEYKLKTGKALDNPCKVLLDTKEGVCGCVICVCDACV